MFSVSDCSEWSGRSICTMTDAGIQPQRTNRRGDATRQNMLEAALKALATGDPGAVSANRIAKQIGATWGVVQYQFGGADGLWAAVLHRTAEHRADVFAPTDATAPLRQRVATIIDTLYDGLTATTRGRSRTCAPRCRATPPSSNAFTPALRQNSSRGGGVGSPPARMRSPT